MIEAETSMLLVGDLVGDHIADIVRNSREPRIAVAFWGEGGAERLGLLDAGGRAIVICNLGLGGTNPDEVLRLLDAGVKVFRKDDLHAKVYLGSHAAVVGSSNASANGLGMQGEEQSGWWEANLRVDEPKLLKELEIWFDRLLGESKLVERTDLPAIRLKWLRRRALLPLPPSNPQGRFAQRSRRQPKAVRGPAALCAYLRAAT